MRLSPRLLARLACVVLLLIVHVGLSCRCEEIRKWTGVLLDRTQALLHSLPH